MSWQHIWINAGASSEVNAFEKPCVEQYKQSVLESTATYINKDKIARLSDAAALAEAPAYHWWVLERPENRFAPKIENKS